MKNKPKLNSCKTTTTLKLKSLQKLEKLKTLKIVSK